MTMKFRVAARADGQRTQKEIQGFPNCVGMRIRPEVSNTFPFASAHHMRPRPLLIECDRKPGIALVVLQPDVVARPMLFDQVVFEEERFNLSIGFNPVDRMRLIEHCNGASLQRSRRSEVVRNVNEDFLPSRHRGFDRARL